MTREFFNKQFAAMVAAFPAGAQRLTAETQEIYWNTLKDTTEVLFMTGMLKCLRECKFFPKIAELSKASLPAKAQAELKSAKICSGGLSFNCRRVAHAIGKVENVLCFRCKTRMGCSRCVENVGERICLHCQDWASRSALEKHGPMVKDPAKKAEGMKILMMIYDGKLTAEEGNKIFEELW